MAAAGQAQLPAKLSGVAAALLSGSTWRSGALGGRRRLRPERASSGWADAAGGAAFSAGQDSSSRAVPAGLQEEDVPGSSAFGRVSQSSSFPTILGAQGASLFRGGSIELAEELRQVAIEGLVPVNLPGCKTNGRIKKNLFQSRPCNCY